MTIFCVFKKYEYDDHYFLLAIYATKELAEKQVTEQGEDSDGRFETWVNEETLITQE